MYRADIAESAPAKPDFCETGCACTCLADRGIGAVALSLTFLAACENTGLLVSDKEFRIELSSKGVDSLPSFFDCFRRAKVAFHSATLALSMG